jgi:hypothetical protein
VALHAGFAVAISISVSAMQQFLHAAYVNDLIPARYQGVQNLLNSAANPPLPYQLEYDLVSSEPIVALASNDEDLVHVRLELFGTLRFTATGVPTQSCDVVIRATIGFPIRMDVNEKTKTARFGLNPAVLPANIDPFSVKRTAGTDPEPIYGFDLNSLKSAIWFSLLGLSPNSFLFTPPLLDQVLALGYTLSPPQVRLFDHAITIGIDMAGHKTVGNIEVPIETFGDVSHLVDLNTVSTEKGWTKTLSEAIPDGYDEYGEPLTKTGWTKTKKRPSGPHKTQLATSMNSLVIAEFWDRIGRYEVVRALEDAKHDAVVAALAHLKGHPTYNLPDLALVVVNEIEATLANGYLQVTGKATHHGSPQVTSTFHFKLFVIRTQVDGSTAFLVAHSSTEGITAEVGDVVIDTPEWVTVLQVVGAIVGVALAPFTSGVSLIVVLFFELVVSSIVGSVIANAESALGSGIGPHLPIEQARVQFTLPDSKGPTLVLQGNDLVIKDEGAAAWLSLSTAALEAKTYVKGGPGYWQPDYSWPVSNRKSIVVVFDDGDSLYNPKDTRVRIRWQLFGDSLAQQIDELDARLLGDQQLDPMRFRINHAKPAWDGFERFFVKCRVYRPFGDTTVELFQQQTKIAIDDRLHRSHRYVRWKHEVHYVDYSAKIGDENRALLGWTSEKRPSKVHYTSPDKRCRFADDYSQRLDKDDLDYFDDLPFAIADVEQHRKLICPYCFFGGPTKHVLK